MASGGYRPGAGRPPKSAAAVTDFGATVGAGEPVIERTPLEYMLAVMNDPLAEESRRDRMAIAAAPFVHGKAGELGKKGEKQKAAEVAQSGKFSRGEPPRLVIDNR